MSIANLFQPNDYGLFCKFMAFGNGSSINLVLGDPAVLTDVTGCIVLADFLEVYYFRLNNTVTIRWRQFLADQIATAAAPLSFTIGEAIAARYRPSTTVTSICGIIGDVAGVARTFPGQASVDPSGVLTFTFLTSAHAANPNWSIGEHVGIMGGTITYTCNVPV